MISQIVSVVDFNPLSQTHFGNNFYIQFLFLVLKTFKILNCYACANEIICFCPLVEIGFVC